MSEKSNIDSFYEPMPASQIEKLESEIGSSVSQKNTYIKTKKWVDNNSQICAEQLENLEEQIRIEELKKKLRMLRNENSQHEGETLENTGYNRPTNEVMQLRDSVRFPNLDMKRDSFDKREEKKIVFELARNSSKVPKFEGKTSLIEFLCKDVYFFTIDNGIRSTKDCVAWIHHCFRLYDCRERLQRHLNEIVPVVDENDIKEFLRILGTRLTRSKEKIEPSKDKRRAHECIEDVVFRLLAKANRASENESTSMNLIKETLVEMEKDPKISLEINRFLFKKQLSPQVFRDCAEWVDMMLRLGELKMTNSVTFDPIIEIDSYGPKKEEDNKCIVCKKYQPRKDRYGNFFPKCYDCSRSEISRNLGNDSRPRNNTRICQECKAPHCDKSPVTGRIYPYCTPCHTKYQNTSAGKRSYSGHDSRYPPLNVKNFSEVTTKKEFCIYTPEAAELEIALADNLMIGNKRIVVNLESSNGLKCRGLVDSGANGCVIKKSLLQQYGLENKIISREMGCAHGFDGTPVKVLGTIELPIKAGGNTFSLIFDCVDEISNFGALLGTPYLDRLGIMSLIESKLEKNGVDCERKN